MSDDAPIWPSIRMTTPGAAQIMAATRLVDAGLRASAWYQELVLAAADVLGQSGSDRDAVKSLMRFMHAGNLSSPGYVAMAREIAAQASAQKAPSYDMAKILTVTLVHVCDQRIGR